MSNRAKLRDLAAEFRQTPAEPSRDTAGDGVDLDAKIAKRMAQAKGRPEQRISNETAAVATAVVTPLDEPIVEAKPTSSRPKKRAGLTKPGGAAVVDATAPVPRPVVREPGNRSRIALDIPVQFEHIRKSAKKMGMSATALVLAALEEHGDSIAHRAASGLLPIRSEAVKRWTLLMTGAELAELDRLVDAVEPGLGRRSRSAVVGLLLGELPD